MFKFVVVCISLSFSLVFPHAHASEAATSQSAHSIPLRGTLYRIDHNGQTAWLFGTVHVGQSAFYPLEPQVMQALHQADTLVVESDIRNTTALRQAIAQHALYPDADNISNHLPPADLTRLKQALANAHIPFANVQRMKPWMIANVLLVQTMALAGFPPEQGIEQHFLEIATTENKQVRELEDAAYALSLFNELTPAQQQAYLHETLQELQDGSAITKATELIDAWRRADNAQLEKLHQRSLTEQSVSSRFLHDMLLDRRNLHMTDSVIALLGNENKMFVAVGALHLIGAGSIPQLLTQRGYRVTRLY